MNLHIQEVQQILSRINLKTFTPRHIVRTAKRQRQIENLEQEREVTHHIQGILIMIYS